MIEEAKRAEKLRVLLEVGRRLASNMDLDSLLELIIEQTTIVMEADRSSLFLVDKKTQELWSKIAQGTQEIRFPIGKGIAGYVAKTGKIINIRDAYKDKRFNPEVDKKTGYRTKTILCAPLTTTTGEIVGVVQVLNKKGDQVFTDFDEEMLLALAGQAAVAITNAMYHQEVLQKQKLERDLQIARTVQESFLPQELPKKTGYQFAAHYDSAQEVGGDFYDFIPLSEDQLAILMGDVSGKGVPAALFMARLMSDFRFVSLSEDDPKDILAKVNDILVRRSRRGMFVTIIYIILDMLKGRITYSSAGHLPPLLVKANGKVHKLVSETGVPLGIAEGQVFAQDTLPLEEGDVLLLYTDGLLEARNSKKQEFGFNRIEKALKEHRGLSAGEIEKELYSSVMEFVKDTPQHDDLTYIVIKATTSVKKESVKPAVKSRRGKGKGFGVSLSVPSDPKFLAVVRKNIDAILDELPFTEKEKRKIVLATDEATSNVIKYSYEGDTTKRIDFEIGVEGGKLFIKIRDYGKTPDLSRIKPRDIDDIRPGGLGTHFLREVMDTVDYDVSLGVGTLLTLTKKIPARESAS